MAPTTTPTPPEIPPLAPPARCLNCGHALSGPFCSQCGQEATEPVPRLGDLLREVVDEFLKVDAKVLRTLRSLLFRPGQITADYAAGKRASYVAPFKLYFATSFLYYLLMAVLNDRTAERMMKPDRVAAPDAVAKALTDGAAFYLDHAATIAILLLPLNALALAVVFYGRRQPIVLHLVATLHTWSGSVMLYLPIYVVAQLLLKWFPSDAWQSAVPVTYMAFMFGYQFLAFRRLFRASKVESALKSLAVVGWTCFVSMLAFLTILIGFALYGAGTARAERGRKEHAKEQQISRRDASRPDGPERDRGLQQPRQ